MAYLVESEARAVGLRAATALRKSAAQALRDLDNGGNHFDVFLSHAIADADLVLGIVEYLTRADLSVYVDWINDPQLDRTKVNKDTAERLRERMQQCKMLFYAWSKSASESRWMPWELGYFDARGGRIAILPLVRSAGDNYVGTEYVGLYPTVEVNTNISTQRPIVKVGGLDPKSFAGGLRTAREVLDH